MRRKPGTLISIEEDILRTGIALSRKGASQFHGFLIAKEMQRETNARTLTAHGTLYKALDRLEKAGFLVSRWEDPAVAANEGRPRRRHYRVTAKGEEVLARARSATSRATRRRAIASS